MAITRAPTPGAPAPPPPPRGVSGQEIVAGDPDPGKAITLGAVDDGAGGLLRQWNRDRPMVVLTEEDDRRLEDAGKIHGFIPVALRGGAVPEGRDNHLVGVLEAAPHGA